MLTVSFIFCIAEGENSVGNASASKKLTKDYTVPLNTTGSDDSAKESAPAGDLSGWEWLGLSLGILLILRIYGYYKR